MKKSKKVFLMAIALGSLTLNPAAFAKATTPQELLADNENGKTINGVNVRKGTIGAFILNVNGVEELLVRTPYSNEISAFKTSLREAIPALNAVKLFDLITIDEFLNAKHTDGTIHQAKVLVGAFYLQQFPEATTSQRLTIIENLRPHVSKTVRDELDILCNATLTGMLSRQD